MELEGIRTAGQAARPGIDTATGNQAVDKEAFLKLLVAQLQQQDPLSPVDGTEWVAQLAQFSVVEQQMQQSEQLDLISLQLTGIASNEAIGLIGKEVTVQGDMISFDGVEATGFSVDLQKPAAEVTVTIRDAQGNAVKTMELGAQKALMDAIQAEARARKDEFTQRELKDIEWWCALAAGRRPERERRLPVARMASAKKKTKAAAARRKNAKKKGQQKQQQQQKLKRKPKEKNCLLYTSPSPRDRQKSRMPSSA